MDGEKCDTPETPEMEIVQEDETTNKNDESETAYNQIDDFDGYISVVSSDSDDDSSSLLELPVAEDGTLSIATLIHSFPEAIGLKFKNPTNGVYRTLAVDDERRCILAPRTGWSGHRYVVIYPPAVESRKRACSGELCEIVGKKHSGQANERLNESLRVPVDLIVLNLSYKTDEEALTKFFEQYGEVQYCEIKRDYRTNLPKGYAFIKMTTLEAQEKILNQREFFIDGRMSQVKLPNHNSNPPNTNDWAGVNDPDMSTSVKLYVGRIWNTLTEDDLRNAFTEELQKISSTAKVERIYIPKPHRGFAFVTINDMRAARQLCSIRDFIIVGKSVCVSFPTPKSHLQHLRQAEYANTILQSSLQQYIAPPPKMSRSTYSPPSYGANPSYQMVHSAYSDRSTLFRSPTNVSMPSQMNYSRGAGGAGGGGGSSWN